MASWSPCLEAASKYLCRAAAVPRLPLQFDRSDRIPAAYGLRLTAYGLRPLTAYGVARGSRVFSKRRSKIQRRQLTRARQSATNSVQTELSLCSAHSTTRGVSWSRSASWRPALGDVARSPRDAGLDDPETRTHCRV